MAVFEYKALDEKGKSVKGLVEADSARAARSQLRRQGVMTTEIREGKASALKRGKSGKAGDESGKKKLSLDMEIDLDRYFSTIGVADIATMTRQLATLTGSGIPLIECLAALVDQIEKEKLQLIVSQIKDRVNEGISLARALGEHPKVFSPLYINMVRAGEASGALEQVLERLADYTENQNRLKNKLLSALLYPAVMTLAGSGLLLFLMVKVIPTMEKMFRDMGADLPLFTQAVIGASQFVSSYWWLLMLVGGGSVYFFRRWLATEKGRRTFDIKVLDLPVFGLLLRKVAISRFSSTLSTLLSSGVPLLAALDISEAVVRNVVIAEAVGEARISVKEGNSLAGPLRASGQFPPLVTHMVAIGERTGKVEPMLKRVASAYETQVDNALEGLTSLLEPILILVLGGSVGVMALAVLLPMLNLKNIAH